MNGESNSGGKETSEEDCDKNSGEKKWSLELKAIKKVKRYLHSHLTKSPHTSSGGPRVSLP